MNEEIIDAEIITERIITERTAWGKPLLVEHDYVTNIRYYLAHTSDGAALVLLISNVTGVFHCPKNWILV